MGIALEEIEINWNGRVAQILQNPYVANICMPINPEMSGQGIGMNKYKGLAWAPGYGGKTSFKLEWDPETPNMLSVDYDVPIQQSTREILRRDFQTYLNRGIPATSAIAQQMLIEVKEQQNLTMIQGWDPEGQGNYATLGMYNVASSATTDAGSSFSTNGGARNTAAKLIGLLKKQKIFSTEGYNMFLNPADNATLMASYSSVGIPEYIQVLDQLNFGVLGGGRPGQIIETPAITAGTCMVAPTASENNRVFFETIVPQTVYNNLWYEDGNVTDGNIRCRQVSSIFPTFARLDKSTMTTNCIAKATAIA